MSNDPFPVQWSRLQERMRGRLILPGDPLYDAVRRPFNARVDQHPAAVARCVCDDDVVACVRFCVDAGIAITPRSGGHGAEGWCSRDGELMVDLSAMQHIETDLENMLIHVGGGCFWGQVDIATYPRSVAAPGGGCAEVGVGGLAQGGGFGPIARTHGMTIDNLVSVEIVTARDGQVIVADAVTNPDLFWALRGGGGGNFGVVTKFTFRLHPIGRAFQAGTIVFAWGADTRKVFQFYRDWMRAGEAGSDPRYERLTFLPLFAFDGTGAPLCALSTFYNGDPDEGLAYVQEIFQQYGVPTPAGPPVDQALQGMTLPAYTGTESTTAWPGSGQYWKSGFLRNDFPDEAIDTFMAWFVQAPKPSGGSGSGAGAGQKAPDLTFGFIESLGGAIGRVAPMDTAFFWRDQLFSFSFIGIYPADDPGMQQEVATWAANFRAAMEPYLAGGVYVNYVQGDLPDWQQAYYGDHYPRLRAIKEKYDPTHTFRFPQDLMQ